MQVAVWLVCSNSLIEAFCLRRGVPNVCVIHLPFTYPSICHVTTCSARWQHTFTTLILCRDELHGLLKEEKLVGATLLILANKQDLRGALPAAQIREVELHPIISVYPALLAS